MGGERGWAPDADPGNFGSEVRGKLAVVGDRDGLLLVTWSRLGPPMWLEWFDPDGLPTVAGSDILPRGRRKRWSSSSPPPSRAKLREVGGSMVPAVAARRSAARREPRRRVKTGATGAGAARDRVEVAGGGGGDGGQ